MLWILWAISLVAAFSLGYLLQGLLSKIKRLEEEVKKKVDKKEPAPEKKSELIDPYDPVQTAQWELTQRMKDLNPNG